MLRAGRQWKRFRSLGFLRDSWAEKANGAPWELAIKFGYGQRVLHKFRGIRAAQSDALMRAGVWGLGEP